MRTDRHEQLRRISRLNKFVLLVALLWTVASFALPRLVNSRISNSTGLRRPQSTWSRNRRCLNFDWRHAPEDSAFCKTDHDQDYPESSLKIQQIGSFPSTINQRRPRAPSFALLQ